MDPRALETTSGLIERWPVAVAGALFLLSFATVLTLYLRHVEKAKREAAEASERHEKEVAKLNAAHATEIRELHENELKRAVRFESTVSGLVRVAEAAGLEVAAYPRRDRRRKPPRTNPGTQPDAPTVLTSIPDGKVLGE